MIKIPQILKSKYRTWNGKRPDKMSGFRPQTKTLLIGETKSNQIKSDQMMVFGGGENRRTSRKTSRRRVENRQTQPTYDAGSGN